jgi:hypothetical protein
MEEIMAERRRHVEEEMENPVLPPDFEPFAVPTPVVSIGSADVATITVTSATPFTAAGAWIQWGTATGVYTSGLQYFTKFKIVTTYNATNQPVVSYVFTFKIPNLQLNAGQAYFAQVVLQDRTTSSEVTWTQPGQNTSPNDQVFFYDKVATDFAAIMQWATKASSAGWMLPDQWSNFKNLVVNTAWYNYVKWNDGR